jgi:protein TonB
VTALPAAAPEAPPISPNDRLGLTLFLAAIVHAIVILGIGFTAELKEHLRAPSLDVVIVQTASDRAPDKAEHIAQVNSQASGSASADVRPTSPVLGPSPVPTAGEAPIVLQAMPATQPESLESILLGQAPADVQMSDQQREQLQDALSTGHARAQLNLELARLTSELAEESQRYAQRPRINYLDTLSAKSAVEAAYIQAWVDKVERVGNLNYPDDARRRKLSGRLILHVLLDQDGNVVNAFIGSPSGQQVLDDAAMRIVKQASPFMPFSPEMRERYDQLMITRTWIFEAAGELTTR